MPCRHHSLRTREYGSVALHSSHGDGCEIIIEIIMFLATVMFVAASALYYSGLPPACLIVAELLWMIGSLIFFVVSVVELCELCGSSEKPILSVPVFHEQMAYLVSTLVFTIGTVLLWSGLYGGNAANEEKGEMSSCFFLIAGSFGFLVANIWNWMTLTFSEEASDGETNSTWACLTRAALLCATLGSVFFILGSWLFSLDVEDGCDEYLPAQLLTANQTKARSGKWCVSIDDQGTWLFVIGSLLFLLQNGLNLAKLCVKHNSTYDEVDAGEDSERLLE